MSEIIVSAKTVDAAIALGAQKLEKETSEVKYEIIEEGKKGILGFGAVDAKVKVYCEGDANCTCCNCNESAKEIVAEDGSPEKAALDLLETIISDIGINAHAKIVRTQTETPEGKAIPEKNVYVEIEGENLGSLIGRHGDVLDSLQYLANIAAGRKAKSGDEKKEYIKICLDIENYRAKREDTLRALARRMAEKALKYEKNMTLEPMLAYERKVIHAELQDYEGVFTYSVGSDSDRRIVIALGTPENPIKPKHSRSRGYGRRNYDSYNSYDASSDEE